MPTSRKKVIVRTVQGAVQPGYLPITGIVADSQVELLDLEGRLLPIALASIRWIAFVRDFNLADQTDPERLNRRIFLARPRTEGLWLRLTLEGGDLLEGLAPLDRSLLDALVEDRGVFLIPPDVRANTQRLYIPHSVIDSLQVLAVITNPSKVKTAPRPVTHAAQSFLFPDSGPDPRTR